MKFVNDYLNDEEMKEFEKRAIPYPNDRPGVIGYYPYVNENPLTWLRCTLDREEKVYLFYCGKDRYDFENIPEKDYFVLISDKILGDSIVTFTAKQEYLSDPISGRGYGILWKLTSLNLPGVLKERRDKIENIIKDAMSAYGVSGNPEANVNYTVEFDF